MTELLAHKTLSILKAKFGFIIVTYGFYYLIVGNTIRTESVKFPFIGGLKQFNCEEDYMILTSFDDLYKLRTHIINHGYKINWKTFSQVEKNLSTALHDVYKLNLSKSFNEIMYKEFNYVKN